MPQHESRVSGDKVEGCVGLPVARITNKIHENDLKMGRVSITTPRFWARRRERHLPRLYQLHNGQLLAPAWHHPHGQRS
jgi:hypothetical protein